MVEALSPKTLTLGSKTLFSRELTPDWKDIRLNIGKIPNFKLKSLLMIILGNNSRFGKEAA